MDTDGDGGFRASTKARGQLGIWDMDVDMALDRALNMHEVSGMCGCDGNTSLAEHCGEKGFRSERTRRLDVLR